MITKHDGDIKIYKGIIDSIFLLINGDIRQEIPQVNDKQLQSKIDVIYNRLKDNDMYCDNVYAYFFVEQKSVYIGRTLHLKLRDTQHRLDKDSTVFKFAKEHCVAIPQMTILERFKTIEEGVKKEDYYCMEFKKDGWNLLNIAPTGDMSNTIGAYKSTKWDFQKCYIEAKKYKTIKDFRKNSKNAYNASVRHGFLKDFEWIKGRILNKKTNLSYDDCKNVALKYDTLKDFSKFDRRVERFARARGWTKDFTWLKREKEHSKAVEQCSLDGTLLNTYKSVNEASIATSIPYSRIYSCCNGRKVRFRDFLWRYKK